VRVKRAVVRCADRLSSSGGVDPSPTTRNCPRSGRRRYTGRAGERPHLVRHQVLAKTRESDRQCDRGVLVQCRRGRSRQISCCTVADIDQHCAVVSLPTPLGGDSSVEDWISESCGSGPRASREVVPIIPIVHQCVKCGETPTAYSLQQGAEGLQAPAVVISTLRGRRPSPMCAGRRSRTR